jgi:hypothetical protein
MAYQCPRCNGDVRRGINKGATAFGSLLGGGGGGLLVAVFSFVIGCMQCERCGPIPRQEFPREVRTEMFVGSLAIVGAGALALVGAVYLLWLCRH